MAKAKAHWDYWKAPNGKWRIRLVASNGEIIIPPEGYSRKEGALNAIASIRANVRAKVAMLSEAPPDEVEQVSSVEASPETEAAPVVVDPEVEC